MSIKSPNHKASLSHWDHLILLRFDQQCFSFSLLFFLLFSPSKPGFILQCKLWDTPACVSYVLDITPFHVLRLLIKMPHHHSFPWYPWLIFPTEISAHFNYLWHDSSREEAFLLCLLQLSLQKELNGERQQLSQRAGLRQVRTAKVIKC